MGYKGFCIKENFAHYLGYLKSTITRNRPDISKISRLGWEPVTGIREGFIKTIRSFLNDHNH